MGASSPPVPQLRPPAVDAQTGSDSPAPVAAQTAQADDRSGSAPRGVAPLGQLRVLFLFAGAHKKQHLQDVVHEAAAKCGRQAEVQGFDLSSRGRHLLARRAALTVQVRKGHFSAVVAVPPCKSFARALWT